MRKRYWMPGISSQSVAAGPFYMIRGTECIRDDYQGGIRGSKRANTRPVYNFLIFIFLNQTSSPWSCNPM